MTIRLCIKAKIYYTRSFSFIHYVPSLDWLSFSDIIDGITFNERLIKSYALQSSNDIHIYESDML